MIQPFVPAEFNTWKTQVDAQERVLPQTEKVNKRISINERIREGGVPYSYNTYGYVSHYDDYIYGGKSHTDYPYSVNVKYYYHYDYYSNFYGNYQDHYNGMGPAYHMDGYRGGYNYHSEPAHSDYNSSYYYHSDGGGYTYSTHHDGATAHYDYYKHSDVGFDHNDFVPSTPRIYQVEDATTPHIKGTTTLGFYSYDKNIDGFGSQDTRSKTVTYDVRIRQTKDINGVAKVSAWRNLVTNLTTQTYNLNTVDPLGTGNTNGILTAGFYEIEVTARNAPQTVGGVSQTYESTKLTKTVKIQQNQDPTAKITNPTSFVNFTFGKDGIANPAKKLYTYEDYANAYGLSKFNGILANMVVTEKDKDQYLKGTGWLETSAGAKIAGTEQNIVWENGNTSIKTNGISDYTAQLFIPKDKIAALTSGTGYKVVIQIKDYLDAGCTQSAGGTILQKTVSSTDLTQLVVAMDMVMPTVTFTAPSASWQLDPKPTVTITDDYIGVEKWRYRILTNGIETLAWTSYKTTASEVIAFTQTGSNVIEVQALDKTGNTREISSGVYKVDKTAPDITLTPSTTAWVNPKVVVAVATSDSESGIKRIQTPDGVWKAVSSLNYDITVNGTYTFVVENNVGLTTSKSIEITNIDLTIPEIFGLKAPNVEETSIELEITEASDGQSGLHDSPYRFSKDNGVTWTAWQTTNKYNFTGLNLNKIYSFKAEIRDLVGLRRDSSLSVSTLTKDIELKYSKSEGSNEVNLNIDLKGNPDDALTGTLTMITRQNLITNEVVTIKDWSTSTTFRDRVPTFVVGYRYSAYAKNRDNVIGNSSAVIVKDIEKPELSVKGFGSDKYVYDETTQSLFILGVPSGHIEIGLKTIATDKLMYNLKDSVGTVIKEGESYGRVGEYRHIFTAPVGRLGKEVYTLKPQAEYEDINTGEKIVKDLILPNNKINVYYVNKMSDLLDLNVTPVGADINVTYNYATKFKNPSDSEVVANPTMRTLLATLDVFTDGAPTTLARGGNQTLNPGNLTIQKQVGGGLYKETFKQDSVLITTNISPFITELKDEWNLEVYVLTEKRKYTLPGDKDLFEADGYSLEVFLNSNPSITGITDSEKYQKVKTGGTLIPTPYKFNSATVGTIGVKVVDVLPSYHVSNLNLQSDSQGVLSLDVIGNPNIKYDNTFIYNQMTSKMKHHGESLYDSDNKKWIGTVFYRTDSGNSLVLITKDRMRIIDPNTLEEKGNKTQSNTGGVVSGVNLYIGTPAGLQKVKSNGDLELTTVEGFTGGINHLASDGSMLYIVDTLGLKIIDTNIKPLKVKQTLTNTDIFGGNHAISSIHVSNNQIYVRHSGMDENEYVIIGK